MITRVDIYEEFTKYLEHNSKILNNKLAYYKDRLTISNNKLEIFNDSISRHKQEIKAIYDIDSNLINECKSTIIYVNNVVINNNKVSTKSINHDILSKLKEIKSDYGYHTILFIREIIVSYFDIKKEIQNINRELQLIQDKIDFLNKYDNLSKNIVYYIISRCNKYYEKALLDGETIHLGYHIGFLKVVPKQVKGRHNWKASFEYKDKLISEGKIPYNKEDALRAKKDGIGYNGVPWFVYYDNEVQHYINWYCYSHKLPNKDSYTFKPSRYNKTNKGIDEIKKEISSIKELDNLRLGIVNKLNIALDTNELQFIKYTKDDIQVSRS